MRTNIIYEDKHYFRGQTLFMRTNIINEDTFVYKNNIYVQILFVRTIIIIMGTQSMYVHTNYNDEDKHY